MHLEGKTTVLNGKCDIVSVNYLAWKLILQNSEHESYWKGQVRNDSLKNIDLDFQNWLPGWGHKCNLHGVFTVRVAKFDYHFLRKVEEIALLIKVN